MNNNSNNKSRPEIWFSNEISSGLQRLLAQGLEYQPPSETIAATEENWVDAIWPSCLWDERRDTSRIREAFRRLIAECYRWPQPAQFKLNLPKIELKEQQLTRLSSSEVREREMKKIADIINLSDYTKAS